MRRAATAACLTLIVAARTYAQSPAPPPPSPDFLTRYDFHLAANVLAIDDPRFSWETHFGGDLDLVDYVAGRASMLVDYQAILGDQLRPFDPNQSYYVLEASSSYPRSGGGNRRCVPSRLAASQRPGQDLPGGLEHHRCARVAPLRGGRRQARRLWRRRLRRRTFQRRLLLDRRPGPRPSAAPSPRASRDLRSGHGDVFGVDGTGNRGTQTGGRVEAGVRFNGRGGALELFAGFERRIDADPLDFQAQRWAIAGFRLVSR